MTSLRFAGHSLKTTLTLFTLTVFVIGVWALAFYTGRLLREDMERLLGEQQLATASVMAANVNRELDDRLKALETFASGLSAAVLEDPAVLQVQMEQRQIFQQLFNGGTFVTGIEGTAIASFPTSANRIGVNYLDRDHIAAALKEGKSTIGQPVIGKKLGIPLVSMGVPIHDAQGKVIGSLTGVTALGGPNFLDRIMTDRHGKGGSYAVLVARHSRLIITASDKRLVMTSLSAPGTKPLLDRFIQGYEGSGFVVNAMGKDVLASAKGVPVAGWYVAVGLPAEEAFAPIHAIKRRLLLATILFTLLAGGMIWWLTARILNRRLSPMIAAARALTTQSAADRLPQPLPITRQDEIGDLIGGFNDLLERVRKRECDLKESEEQFRMLIDRSTEPILVHQQGMIVFANPAAVDDLGAVAAADLLGKPIMPIIHPAFRQLSSSRIEEVYRTGNALPIAELKFVRLDGEVIDVEARSSRTTFGGAHAIQAAWRNISDRKHREEALAKLAHIDEERRFLAQIVESATYSITSVTLDGTYTAWNPGAEKLFGYRRDEMIGRSIFSLMTPEETIAEKQRLERVAHGEPLSEEEAIRISRSGKKVYLSLSVSPICDSEGKVIGVSRVAQDITAIKEAERRVLTLNAELEQRVADRTRELAMAKLQAEAASVAKSAFLTNMSHEIRTPMNGILGMANILRREGVTSKQAQRLDTINASAQHLLAVINNILDISKIEAGKFALEEAPVIVSSLMNNVSSILAERVKDKNIRLLIETEHLPRNLVGDPTRLQQALLNYATNAVKFTDQGTVTLRSIKQEETTESLKLRFEVTDTGIGIAPEAMSRLFSAFEQADNSMNRKYGGTGLGLAITQRLAELMGGEAGADSTPGVGSTFWFTAILTKRSEAATAPMEAAVDAEAEIRRRYSGHRILVVDDEPINREVAVIQLEAVDLVTDTAEDGAEAVLMAQKNSYAAIFMDMQMPKLNGVEATQEIRHIPGYRDKPIIAMTANAFAEDKAQCIAAGMNDFLIKPFNPDELFAVLLRSLSRSEE